MSHEQNIRTLLSRGDLLSSREIARRTGLSQPTVSRTLSGMADTILIGAGRGSRFGLKRHIGNHGDSWPLYRITENGMLENIGILGALVGDRWFIDFQHDEPLYSLGLKRGISEGWPWFLDELRPQGFMGRAFAKQYHRQLGASPDLNLWGSDQFLLTSYIFGDDLPGNLMVGQHPHIIPESADESVWPEFAMAAVRGNPPGSSAGGERPKFSSGKELVKFANREEQHGRWADLLVAEATASEVLREQQIPSAYSRIVEIDDLVFLAVQRFDRTGSGGRLGVHSLAAIDGALYGLGAGSWVDIAENLYLDGLISFADRETIQHVWDFGRAIRNTDMHFGNLGFHPTSDGRLKVAPVYDMLPMAYAPNAAGVPDFESNIIPFKITQGESMASEFWERLSTDSRISEVFRRIARLHLKNR